MNCPVCKHSSKKFGKTKAGRQRFRCHWCSSTFVENHNPLGSMRIAEDKAFLALQILVEGGSIRSAERITGIHRDTILRLLQFVGTRCQRLMDEKMRDLSSRFIQVDEIWTFVQKKQRGIRPDDPAEFGDAYCFYGLDPETKLVPTFTVGNRDTGQAISFMTDLSERVQDGIQLSTDGFTPYLDAVRIAFLEKVVHYGQIVKVYAATRPGPARYAPPRFTSAQRDEVYGRPDREHISTSLIERKNLTLRMHLRRFTRLTNAFSKKLDNLRAALSLHFAFYNFCRKHSTIKQTPAMAAGLADHVWTMRELLEQAATLA